MCLHHRKQTIKIKQTKQANKLLIILLNLNIIYGWHIILYNKKNYYIVYCNIKNTKQLFTLLKPSKQFFLKFKNLQKLSKNYSTKNIYLTTSKGIISITNAINKKIGGILFFKIR